jgi:hypothetical protein
LIGDPSIMGFLLCRNTACRRAAGGSAIEIIPRALGTFKGE